MNTALFALAFGAGLLSFLSPCVLPLVPIYVGYLSGAIVSPQGIVTQRRETVEHALAFVLGFTTIFVTIWSALFALTQYIDKSLLGHVAGVFILILGVHLIGLVRLPFFYREARVNFRSTEIGLPRSFFTGMAFAAGWTPCVGPMLSFILSLATQTPTALQGTGLLLFYSAGLGVPFLLSALGLETANRKLRGLNRYLRYVEVGSGLLLLIMGFLLLTDRFQILNAYLFQLTPAAVYSGEGWLQQWLGVKLSP